MNVSKNDLFYILMSIVVAAAGVVAVSNADNRIGLYGLLGLLGIAVVMAIIVKPSLGANILVIAVYTNISDLLTKHGLPGIIKPLVAIVAVALVVRYLYVGQVPIGHSRTARVEYFLLAYFMIVIASFFAAADKNVALIDILDMGKDIVILYCILFALRQAQAWKQTAWLLMITTALLCSLTVYQLVTHNYQQNFFGLSQVIQDKAFGDATTPRIGGPINAPNLWGQILVAVSTLLIFRIIHEKKTLVKVAAFVMLGIISYVILNTYSRGAYLVLGIDIVLILFVFEKLLAETGILGAIAFLGMAFFLIEALNRACRAIERSPHLQDWLPWMNAIRLAVLSYLMTSFILHNAYIRYFWILVALALAGIQITYNLLDNSDRSLSTEGRR